MQFSKIALLLPLVLSSVIASPVREEQLPNQEEAGNALAKRGHGCPIDYFCGKHVGHSTSRHSPATILIHTLVQKPGRRTNRRILQGTAYMHLCLRLGEDWWAQRMFFGGQSGVYRRLMTRDLC
ncbi:MAG: hypothetical protein Q9198_004713 [Flavoplaca austrocitrina]